MKYAILEDGGKQYRAVEGATIEVDRYDSEIGEQIDLDRILLFADGDEVEIGTPFLPGAKIEATVVSHFKGPKVVVFKYKPKERYRRKTGHRQHYTRLRIDAILAGQNLSGQQQAGKMKESQEQVTESTAVEAAAAKKTARKKAVSKPAASKQPAEKKPAEKKPAAKAPAAKKAEPKKPATKKTETKKPATKKTEPKKPASKK